MGVGDDGSLCPASERGQEEQQSQRLVPCVLRPLDFMFHLDYDTGDFDMWLTNVTCKQPSAPELFHRNMKKRKRHKTLGSSVFLMGDILL